MAKRKKSAPAPAQPDVFKDAADFLDNAAKLLREVDPRTADQLEKLGTRVVKRGETVRAALDRAGKAAGRLEARKKKLAERLAKLQAELENLQG